MVFDIRFFKAAAMVCAFALAGTPQTTQACSRLVYLGGKGHVITARSMDWKYDIGTNLYILPRGIARSGEAGPNSFRWTAKYGSVVATGYDVSTTDGANEAGLVANVLWLTESEYPKFEKGSKPGLTIAAWAQYVLDSFPTVEAAVAELRKEPFTIVTDNVPGQDRLTTLHLSLSDATGDSAIIEYIDGKQVIHHGRQYQVMTNSPTYDQQLALNAYWQSIGGTTVLPGTNRAADRFARASFYVNAIPKTGDPNRLLASVFGVIRNVSVPLGIASPDQPEISSTRWRTIFDHKRRLYFFESATTPNTFWVDLNKIDFTKETGRIRRRDLGVDQANVFSGDVGREFIEAPAFHFQGIG